LHIGELTENQAKDICSWKYTDEYQVYNFPNWETAVTKKWGITDENKRKSEFRSVLHDNIFVGFFRLYFRENMLFLGLGLSPEFCGKGYGAELMKIIKKYSKDFYPKDNLHLEVRDFNVRAIQTYTKAGFNVIENYTKDGGEKYVVMEYCHST
jgi:ribosomal protein S18 acetylase RimI-like enzyme